MLSFVDFQPQVGEKSLLSPLSATLRESELVVLSAPSGSGKTRLLETLCHQTLPYHGSFTLSQKVASLPQSLDLCLQLSGLDNVACSRLDGISSWQSLFGFSRKEKQQALHCLESLGFSEGEKTVNLLSGGEKQRVAMARVLNSERRIWILDEPVSNLDESAALECMGVLREACHQRKTCVLCVLHHDTLADKVADRRLIWNGQWSER